AFPGRDAILRPCDPAQTGEADSRVILSPNSAYPWWDNGFVSLQTVVHHAYAHLASPPFLPPRSYPPCCPQQRTLFELRDAATVHAAGPLRRRTAEARSADLQRTPGAARRVALPLRGHL